MSTKTKGDILAERIEKLNASIKNTLWPSGPIIVKALTSALEEYRKSWTLGRSVNGFTLGDGQEWQWAEQWKEEELPEGYRPLLKGERESKDDEANVGSWVKCYSNETPLENMAVRRRTRRPLPSVKKMIPLGPEDAPPGSAFRHPLWPDFEYIIPSFVSEDGIYARLGDDDSVNWSWEYMQKERVSISRDNGKTWQRCEKEAQ